MIPSSYFKREEFACQCGCGFDVVDVELLGVLSDLRLTFGSPVIITSGCRCKEHNQKIGGAENSKHIKGIAVDIKIRGLSPEKVCEYLDAKYPDKYGIGQYKSWTHIDVREERARWEKI